jgi:hypothetical protein
MLIENGVFCGKPMKKGLGDILRVIDLKNIYIWPEPSRTYFPFKKRRSFST